MSDSDYEEILGKCGNDSSDYEPSENSSEDDSALKLMMKLFPYLKKTIILLKQPHPMHTIICGQRTNILKYTVFKKILVSKQIAQCKRW